LLSLVFLPSLFTLYQRWVMSSAPLFVFTLQDHAPFFKFQNCEVSSQRSATVSRPLFTPLYKIPSVVYTGLSSVPPPCPLDLPAVFGGNYFIRNFSPPLSSPRNNIINPNKSFFIFPFYHIRSKSLPSWLFFLLSPLLRKKAPPTMFLSAPFRTPLSPLHQPVPPF